MPGQSLHCCTKPITTTTWRFEDFVSYVPLERGS